jgi:hypothetical protein
MKIADAIRRILEGDPWNRDEQRFRERHVAFGSSELEFERVRPAYHFGWVAAQDERFRGRDFDDVEAELRDEWSSDLAMQCGSWDTVRGFVNRAYQRAQERFATEAKSAIVEGQNADVSSSPRGPDETKGDTPPSGIAV